MKKYVQIVLSSPFILLVSLHNEIGDFVKYLIEYKTLLGFKLIMNWEDTIFRLLVCTAVWLLYKSYLKYRDTTNAKIAELEEKCIRLNNKIKIVDKLSSDSDSVLMELWIESRDRNSENIENIIKIFKDRLNITGIGINKEHPEVKKWKGKMNEKMDEEQERLNSYLHNDDGLK